MLITNSILSSAIRDRNRYKNLSTITIYYPFREVFELTNMKLTVALFASVCATFKQTFEHKVQRSVAGDWVDNNLESGRFRRDVVDSFRPIAAMVAYLKGLGSDDQDPSNQGLEAELQQIQDKYTSYGCYCWANGVDNVEDLGSGSRNVDATDFACTELYRCYACVNVDYGADYNELSYEAFFNTAADGSRQIDCSSNAQQNGDSLCSCDAKFAQKIVQTENHCDSGIMLSDMGLNNCQSEMYRTIAGGGSYQCPMGSNGHPNNDKCCGFYPNRQPYNENRECCATNDIDDQGNFVTPDVNIVALDTCEISGGKVIVSAEGDPHTYIPVVV
ncbi:unnamed protein product [Oikopleura dioica]|uniref:Phospholipase A2 domain-containing protein n=1 Tax=Oikopleura dioica TaxID=34765 RepID=E4YYF1_OIKDI|nr:unnamed protein product [Oikopleura dioica]